MSGFYPCGNGGMSDCPRVTEPVSICTDISRHFLSSFLDLLHRTAISDRKQPGEVTLLIATAREFDKGSILSDLDRDANRVLNLLRPGFSHLCTGNRDTHLYQENSCKNKMSYQL